VVRLAQDRARSQCVASGGVAEIRHNGYYAAGGLTGAAGLVFLLIQPIIGVVLLVVAMVVFFLTATDRLPGLKVPPQPLAAPDVSWAGLHNTDGRVRYAFQNNGPPAVFTARGKWFEREHLPTDTLFLLETDWPIRWRGERGERTHRVERGAIAFLDVAVLQWDDQQREWRVLVLTADQDRTDWFGLQPTEHVIRIELRSDQEELPMHDWICFSLDPFGILSAHPCEVDLPPIAEPLAIIPPEAPQAE
jgi:hypothetical protein